MFDWGVPEVSEFEETLDYSLGICFLLISLFTAFRLINSIPSMQEYFRKSGGGHVIAAFYLLIFITGILRTIWFLIPSEILEGSYVPVAQTAYKSKKWLGTLISEVLLSLGSLALFSIFILMAAFWAHMLHRVDDVDELSTKTSFATPVQQDSQEIKKIGPIQSFAIMMAVLLTIQGVNLLCYLMNFYDSNGMILYDCIFLAVLSLATVIEFSIFSSRFLHVLETIAAINANSTIRQRNRIMSIATTANIFFTIHVILEGTMSIALILLWKQHKPFSHVLQNPHYWDTYIAIKHCSEVVVLSLSLMVSLPLQSSSNPMMMRSSMSNSSVNGINSSGRRSSRSELSNFNNMSMSMSSELSNSINNGNYKYDAISPLSPNTPGEP